MKPCRKNRRLIAWLTLGALEVAREGSLRAHIETCAPCRRYLEEISTVAHRLKAVDTGADIRAHEGFHRRVLSALTAAERTREWSAPLAQWLLNWRVALPVFGATALMIMALASFLQRPKAPLQADTTAQHVPPIENRTMDLPPTFSNYEMVANQSFEKFEELLTRQANKNPPPAPTYRASSLLPETATE